MDQVAALFLTAAAGVSAIFGGGGERKIPPPFPRNEVKLHASSTGKTALNISCVAAAVAAREQAIGGAMTTLGQDTNAAYSARASALASAYAQTEPRSIKASVKKAWNTFNASLKVAHKNWKTAQQSAWSGFKTAIKSCGSGVESVADSANAGADASVVTN